MRSDKESAIPHLPYLSPETNVPLSDEMLGSVMRNIKDGQSAIACIFLAKHPQGLQAHPNGLRGQEFRKGLADMMGATNEKEMSDLLGDLETFIHAMNERVGSILIRTPGELATRNLFNLAKDCDLGIEYSELMLSHSWEHETPFEVFFPREKNMPASNSSLPPRFQVGRAIFQELSPFPIGTIVNPNRIGQKW